MDECVCVCVHVCRDSTAHGLYKQCSTPRCKDWRLKTVVIQSLFFLESNSFNLKLLFHCLSLLPNFPVSQVFSLKDSLVKKKKLPSTQNSLGNRNCINSNTHTDTGNIIWMNELCLNIVCVCVYVCGLNINCMYFRSEYTVCVCVCIHSSNCKKGPIFLSILRYNVIRNISVQEKGFLRILSQHCGGKTRKWVHLSAVTTVNFIENTCAQMSDLCIHVC